jgi:hypothetical protein
MPKCPPIWLLSLYALYVGVQYHRGRDYIAISLFADAINETTPDSPPSGNEIVYFHSDDIHYPLHYDAAANLSFRAAKYRWDFKACAKSKWTETTLLFPTREISEPPERRDIQIGQLTLPLSLLEFSDPWVVHTPSPEQIERFPLSPMGLVGFSYFPDGIFARNSSEIGDCTDGDLMAELRTFAPSSLTVLAYKNGSSLEKSMLLSYEIGVALAGKIPAPRLFHRKSDPHQVIAWILAMFLIINVTHWVFESHRRPQLRIMLLLLLIGTNMYLRNVIWSGTHSWWWLAAVFVALGMVGFVNAETPYR